MQDFQLYVVRYYHWQQYVITSLELEPSLEVGCITIMYQQTKQQTTSGTYDYQVQSTSIPGSIPKLQLCQGNSQWKPWKKWLLEQIRMQMARSRRTISTCLGWLNNLKGRDLIWRAEKTDSQVLKKCSCRRSFLLVMKRRALYFIWCRFGCQKYLSRFFSEIIMLWFTVPCPTQKGDYVGYHMISVS